jgi:cytochrome c oxidase subunit III
MTTITGRARPLSSSTAGFGMIVFLASDVMLFAAFFAAYYLLRSVNAEWPSPLAQLDTIRAGAATVVLLVSSATVVAADRSLQAGRSGAYRRWITITAALGWVFLINQLIEYRSLTFQASSDAYGSIYWMLTGLHTAHVAVGVGALGLLVVRSFRMRTPEALETWHAAISAFWHLVDVVWVGVFLTIWVIR